MLFTPYFGSDFEVVPFVGTESSNRFYHFSASPRGNKGNPIKSSQYIQDSLNRMDQIVFSELHPPSGRLQWEVLGTKKALM